LLIALSIGTNAAGALQTFHLKTETRTTTKARVLFDILHDERSYETQ